MGKEKSNLQSGKNLPKIREEVGMFADQEA